VIATAATLPLYFGSTLALIVLRRRGAVAGLGARAWLPGFAALGALLYCAWASLGIGAEPLLWLLVLGGAGVALYLWYLFAQRRAALDGAVS